MVLGGPRGVRPAAAQLYESTLQSLDYAPDPTARSPRLLGMGRLTLLDDVHNHISLWDFAGNPTGIAEAETASVVEYRPGTRSSEAIRDQWPSTREQEVLRARQLRHGVETWRRGEGGTAYGLVGEVATLERSRPFSPYRATKNPNAPCTRTKAMPLLYPSISNSFAIAPRLVDRNQSPRLESRL